MIVSVVVDVDVVDVAVVGGGCWLLRETRQRWKDDEDDVATKCLIFGEREKLAVCAFEGRWTGEALAYVGGDADNDETCWVSAALISLLLGFFRPLLGTSGITHPDPRIIPFHVSIRSSCYSSILQAFYHPRMHRQVVREVFEAAYVFFYVFFSLCSEVGPIACDNARVCLPNWVFQSPACAHIKSKTKVSLDVVRVV